MPTSVEHPAARAALAALLGICLLSAPGCLDLSLPSPTQGKPELTVAVPRPGDVLLLSNLVSLEANDLLGVSDVTLYCGPKGNETSVVTWRYPPYSAQADFSRCQALVQSNPDGGVPLLRLNFVSHNAKGGEATLEMQVYLDSSVAGIQLAYPARVLPKSGFTVTVTSDTELTGAPTVLLDGVAAESVTRIDPGQGTSKPVYQAVFLTTNGVGADNYTGPAPIPIEVLAQTEQAAVLSLDARGTLSNGLPGNAVHIERPVLLSRLVWDQPISGRPALDAAEPLATSDGLQLPLATVDLVPNASSLWVPGFLSASEGIFVGFQPSAAPGVLDGGYRGLGIDLGGRSFFGRPNAASTDILVVPAPGAPGAASAFTVPFLLGPPVTRVDEALCGLDAVNPSPPDGGCVAGATQQLLCVLADGGTPSIAPGAVATLGNPAPGTVAASETSYLSPNGQPGCGQAWTFGTLGSNLTPQSRTDARGCTVSSVERLLPFAGGSFALALTASCGGAPDFPVVQVSNTGAVSGAYLTAPGAPAPTEHEVLAALSDGKVVTIRTEVPYTVFESWAPGATAPDATALLAGLYTYVPTRVSEVVPRNVSAGADGRLTVLLSGAPDSVAVMHFAPNLQPRWLYIYPRKVSPAAVRLVASATAGGDVYLVDTGNGRSVALRTNEPLTPVVNGTDPAAINLRTPDFSLDVLGTYFLRGAQVLFNGTALPTTFVTSARVTAAVPASAVPDAGTVASVLVQNPNGKTSAAIQVPVQNPPAPTLTSIAPDSAVTGSGSFTLTLTGSDFVLDSRVQLDGVDVPGARVLSPERMEVDVPAASLTSSRDASVTVVTPPPGGGTSAVRGLTVSPTAQDTIAPTVSLTASPDPVLASGVVTLSADARDNVGVTRVVFYRGPVQLGEKLLIAPSPQATVTWDVPVTQGDNGTATFSAIAYDGAGNAKSSAATSISITIDVAPPTVLLSSSATTVNLPTTVTLAASASDDTGVAKVEFFRGATSLGVRTSPPYVWTVNLTAANNGTLQYTAVATDGFGKSTTSNVVSITVDIDTVAPVVSLASSKASVTTPQTITLTAIATDNRGQVAKVEFYRNGVKIGETATAPYTQGVDLGVADNGTITFQAKAYDPSSNVGVSNNVVVTVSIETIPPTVTLAANPTTVTAPGPVTLTATASDASGIARVEFYRNGVLINADLSAPYTQGVNLGAADNGTVQFSARAYDTVGNVGYSAPVTVTVSICSEQLPAQSPVAGTLASTPITLAVDAQDRPVVAWREYSPPAIYVRRWNGAGWDALGSLPLSYNVTNYPFALGLDTQGRPVVAYVDYVAPSYVLSAQVWNGSAWALLGGGPLNPGSWQNVGIGLAMRGDDPVVALSTYVPTVSPLYRILVNEGAAAAWTPLGTGVYRDVPTNALAQPSLAVNGSGLPLLAFAQYTTAGNTDRHVYVSQWDGTQWLALGNELELAQTYYPWPSIAVDGTGAPAVAWTTSDTTYATAFSVGRWNGTAWSPVGNAYAFAQTIAYTDGLLQLVYNPVNGRLAVALTANAPPILGQGAVLVEYDATGWNPTCGFLVDPFEATGYASYLNSVAAAVDSQGRYVVAAISTFRDKIHVQRIAPR